MFKLSWKKILYSCCEIFSVIFYQFSSQIDSTVKVSLHLYFFNYITIWNKFVSNFRKKIYHKSDIFLFPHFTSFVCLSFNLFQIMSITRTPVRSTLTSSTPSAVAAVVVLFLSNLRWGDSFLFCFQLFEFWEREQDSFSGFFPWGKKYEYWK